MECCRYFEREQFHTLCNEIAFVGPQVTQCIKFMPGQSDVSELSVGSMTAGSNVVSCMGAGETGILRGGMEPGELQFSRY